ncbi:NmrA family NAD(P)-binding protein [Streptomyces sp. NPDC001255]|uniref:NmrA family NAD(P)-binding protein n=1 Tax=Streptomyces sp. NPDC001255 TaxID=3364550 RepID=UPI0036816268
MANVLVAGATGMLGSRIAHHLLNQPAVAQGGRLGLLVRAGSLDDPAKRAGIDELVVRGAVVVPGDLHDDGALNEATSGVDVVISAVQGGARVVTDGQVKLARSAERNGVRRFIPSDFAIDIFSADPGAPMFAARRRADEIIDTLNLEVLHVLTGGFLDKMVRPDGGIVDSGSQAVTCWGTGTEPSNMTTVEDTARLTARLALDDAVSAGVHTFAATEATPKQIAEEISRVTGRTYTVNSRGTLDELREAISNAHDPAAAIGLWYQLVVATTPTFTAPENDRYPDIELTTLHEQVRQAFG